MSDGDRSSRGREGAAPQKAERAPVHPSRGLAPWPRRVALAIVLALVLSAAAGAWPDWRSWPQALHFALTACLAAAAIECARALGAFRRSEARRRLAIGGGFLLVFFLAREAQVLRFDLCRSVWRSTWSAPSDAADALASPADLVWLAVRTDLESRLLRSWPSAALTRFEVRETTGGCAIWRELVVEAEVAIRLGQRETARRWRIEGSLYGLSSSPGARHLAAGELRRRGFAFLDGLAREFEGR